ncbi:MAG: MotA/TolQ/ExbB proton channel family protein [Planctomycetota bacterium]
MRKRPDWTTILGVLIGIGAVLGGHHLAEGTMRSLFSGTAFMIVVLGSFGAVLVATPRADVLRGLQGIGTALFPPRRDLLDTRDRLLELAMIARREGLLALEEVASRADTEVFLSRCLTQAIDGTNSTALREIVGTDISIDEQHAQAGARFWETWGSICPTIGVLGAVLGLIHAMKQIATPADVGAGIAVAFVATVYGVGFSNLVCLPLAFKLRRMCQRERVRKSMVLEGVIGIQSGVAPGALRNRLSVYAAEAADG